MDKYNKLIDYTDLLYKLNINNSKIKLPYANCFVNKDKYYISIIELKYLIIFNYF